MQMEPLNLPLPTAINNLRLHKLITTHWHVKLLIEKDIPTN